MTHGVPLSECPVSAEAVQLGEDEYLVPRRAPAPAPAPASRSTDTVWNVRVPGILAVLLVVADRISSPLAYFQTIWTTIESEI